MLTGQSRLTASLQIIRTLLRLSIADAHVSDLAVEEPIDLAHLARYTGGDRRLNCEVFRLFSDQCAQSLRLLKARLDMADGKGWRDAAHCLKGAASGIGAFSLAESARIAEGLDPETDPAHAVNALTTLGFRAKVVLAYIDAYLSSE